MPNKRNSRKRPQRRNKIEKLVCPECKSTKFDFDHSRGEISCKKCGCIIEENVVDMGPEWVAYDPSQFNDRVHTGSPNNVMIHDGGLNTEIDYSNINISNENVAQWYRLRKWHKRSRFSRSRDRNLALALTNLSRKSSNLRLPKSIKENAASIYRRALENKLIRGRTIEGVVSASIYIACRIFNLPRTLDEISDVSVVNRKELGRTYRFIAGKLKIKLTPTSPSDYIPRFASGLHLSEKVQVKAFEIIEESKENGLTTGKGPNGIAAAALYISSQLLGERKTQRDIAEVAGVSEVTVRNRYREISESLNFSVVI